MDKVLVYLALIHKGNWDKIYSDISNKIPVDKKDMEEKLKNSECNYISILNPKYPFSLKQIYKPPFVLFYKGDINLLSDSSSKKIAIVGSRENSEYGKMVTEKICKNIVANSN